MDNFLYCYLSPFVLGVLIVVSACTGVVGAAYVFDKIKNWYKYGIPHNNTAKEIANRVGGWLINITLIITLIGVAIIFGVGMWAIGIEILKRFACK